MTAAVRVVRPAAVIHRVIAPGGAPGHRPRPLQLHRRAAVDDAVPDQDQAAPVTRLPLARRSRGRHDDGRFRRAYRHDPRAPEHEERRARQPLDPRPRLEGQRRAIGHVHEAPQLVDRIRRQHPVAQDVPRDGPPRQLAHHYRRLTAERTAIRAANRRNSVPVRGAGLHRVVFVGRRRRRAHHGERTPASRRPLDVVGVRPRHRLKGHRHPVRRRRDSRDAGRRHQRVWPRALVVTGRQREQHNHSQGHRTRQSAHCSSFVFGFAGGTEMPPPMQPGEGHSRLGLAGVTPQ